MNQLLIDDLDDRSLLRLTDRARRNCRSIADEARFIVEAVAAADATEPAVTRHQCAILEFRPSWIATPRRRNP